MKEQVDQLSLQVGGKGDEGSHAYEKAPVPVHYRQIDHREKGADRSVQKAIPGKIGNGNGGGRKKVSTKTDPEAVIPMGGNRIIEHGEHMNDF